MADALATTIYVGGLARGTTSEELAAAFSAHLAVVHAVAVRTFGFVTFATADLAQQAVELEVSIDGRLVHAALSHARYSGPRQADETTANGRPDEAGASGRVPSGCASCFVRVPSAMKKHSASAVQRALGATCSAHTSAPPRVHVPLRQGGGDRHRGFAFVQCAGAADAAALLAALSAGGEWEAELVKKRHGGKSGGKARGKRGGRRRGGGGGGAGGGAGGGGQRGGGGRAAEERQSDDEEYDDEWFGSEEQEEEEAAEAEEAEEEAAAAGGMVGGEDACVEAMASFVSESREWALGVQGFLIEHC
jgi:uncharacterized membrane protein YgcG